MQVRHCPKWALLATLCAQTISAQQYTISTVAGNNKQGFAGDGSAATGAELFLPGRVLVDSSGNLYIADGGNNRIRKVAGGNISTIAGNGTAGFAGDGKAATSAELNNPTGIAFDSSGNLFIADAENNVIREVATGGMISTVAGTNTAGYAGDGAAAIDAQLLAPTAVVVDSSGNLFIADAGNNVIREVTGGNILTVVGGAATTLQLARPDALAIDKNDDLYIADTADRRILKFHKGVLTVIAGEGGTLGDSGDGGPALTAGFGDPMGIAVDSNLTVYIADTLDSRVRMITPDGIITTIAGNGINAYFGDGKVATKASLYFPHDVTVDSAGNVYIADTVNNVVRVLKPAAPAISANGVVNAAGFKAPVSPGALATVFGTGFGSQAVQASVLPLKTSLAGVTVTVNDKAAPILYAGPAQINFQVPWETAIGTASVVVSVNGRVSSSVSVPVVIAAPQIFVASHQAVVQNSDHSVNSPSNPAKVGSTITAYLTGSGPVSPHIADGAASPSSPPAMITSSFSATIGSDSAVVSFAGLAPTFVGLVQLNIVVPSGLTSGNHLLTVTIAGETSNPANISVTQ